MIKNQFLPFELVGVASVRVDYWLSHLGEKFLGIFMKYSFECCKKNVNGLCEKFFFLLMFHETDFVPEHVKDK